MSCGVPDSMEYCYSSSSSSSYGLQTTSTDTDSMPETTSSSISAVHRALSLVLSDGHESKLEGAREIRMLTKTSQTCRRLLSDSVAPLTSMLRVVDSPESNESALLALLNLAVRDEMNKAKIIEAGALGPITGFLTSESPSLQEYAAATLLTLSASPNSKAVIGSSGAIPLLVETLKHGTSQAKVDAVTALSNLTTHPGNLAAVLEAEPVGPLVDLLRRCKRSSKAAEKCCSLMESLAGSHEARLALTEKDGGVLAVVEVLENGSPKGRDHAVGVLLTMCQSDRHRYREPILGEGVIPGLLEMTVQGTPKAKARAKTLLRLLRDSAYHRSELEPETLENIVCDIISRIDGEDQSGKARKMLAEMVQVSMEQSLRHLQQRAVVCTPSTDLPLNTACTSEVSFK